MDLWPDQLRLDIYGQEHFIKRSVLNCDSYMYTAFLSDAKCLNSFFSLLFKLDMKCVITDSPGVCYTKDDEIPIKKNVYNISMIRLYILTTDYGFY